MNATTPPQRWPAENIWQAVAPEWPGFSAEILPEIDSTNTELMRRARQGLTDPILLVAERQSAGRGRLGRTWVGERGHALTFSVGLPYQPKNWSGLSLAVGLSLAQSLGDDLQLKWPNDLWRQQRKLGGILIEASSQGGQSHVVVGVGLNIQAPTTQDLRTPAASIQEFWKEASAPQVLERIAKPLFETLKRFERDGFAPLQQDFNQRDALRNLNILSSDGLEGLCEGVDAEGALRIRTALGLQTINSSEVSVRPK